MVFAVVVWVQEWQQSTSDGLLFRRDQLDIRPSSDEGRGCSFSPTKTGKWTRYDRRVRTREVVTNPANSGAHDFYAAP